MKYSIIIPVYNAEKYLTKCLDSVLQQTYNNYEIIIINDGSTDNSETIIKKYINKYQEKIKYFYKKNSGVADTRNFGISKASGEYFMFVDSDDYIDTNLLQILNMNDNYDVLSFNLVEVNTEYRFINKIKKPSFNLLTGKQAIVELIEGKEYFDTPVSYMYNKKYWNKHQFKYDSGRYHEDFGLTPLVILYANNVISIEYIGYFYMQSDNSITRNNDIEKNRKKAYDMLHHFDKLYYRINNDEIIDEKTKRIFNSYIANAILSQASKISSEFRNEYIREIQLRKIKKMILSNNIKRKFKKIVLIFSIKLYLKIFS